MQFSSQAGSLCRLSPQPQWGGCFVCACFVCASTISGADMRHSSSILVSKTIGLMRSNSKLNSSPKPTTAVQWVIYKQHQSQAPGGAFNLTKRPAHHECFWTVISQTTLHRSGMQSTAARVRDHAVVDAHRRLTRVQVQQWHRRAEDDSWRKQRREALTDADSIGATTFVPTLGHSASCRCCLRWPALVSWLIYEYNDTVEQRRVPGGSDDERLTDT